MPDDTYRTQLRIPTTVHEQLKTASEASGRSLNAEISYRLEMSLSMKSLSTASGQPSERQKAELLLGFEAWLKEERNSQDEKAAYREFCHLYNGADSRWEQVEPVIGIDEVSPRFLRDLALAWRRYARESVYVHQFTDPTRGQRLAPERRKSELVMTYLRWCNSSAKDPLNADVLIDFCKQYNGWEECKVLDMPEISPGYLEELMSVWLQNLPVQLVGMPDTCDFMLHALKVMEKQQEDKLEAIKVAMSRFADLPPSKR